MKTNIKKRINNCDCHQSPSQPPRARQPRIFGNVLSYNHASPVYRVFENDRHIFSDDFIREARFSNLREGLNLREGRD